MHKLNWESLYLLSALLPYPRMENPSLVAWNQPTNKYAKVKLHNTRKKNPKIETALLLHLRMSRENISKNCFSFMPSWALFWRNSEEKECESEAHSGTRASRWPLSWVILQSSTLQRKSYSLDYKRQETNTSACHRHFVFCLPITVIQKYCESFFVKLILLYHLFLYSMKLFLRKTSAKQIHCSFCIHYFRGIFISLSDWQNHTCKFWHLLKVKYVLPKTCR